MSMQLWIIFALLILLPLTATAQNPDKKYLDDYMRIRGDASGKEVVYHWTGKVFSYVPEQKAKLLYLFEGFNISRTVVNDNGFELLTREAAFFLDPATGKILETWHNPFTDQEVQVQQIWNDPVNQDLTFGEEDLPYVRKILPSNELGEMIVFNNDIFPFYPNPMPRKDYPEFSQSDNYQSAEFFKFFVLKQELENQELQSVPASISWMRISPWMPFMRMGDRAGYLVFSCQGAKIPGGYADLPEQVRDYVQAQHPEYQQAPEEYQTPNATSWNVFKKLVDSGQIK